MKLEIVLNAAVRANKVKTEKEWLILLLSLLDWFLLLLFIYSNDSSLKIYVDKSTLPSLTTSA